MKQINKKLAENDLTKLLSEELILVKKIKQALILITKREENGDNKENGVSIKTKEFVKILEKQNITKFSYTNPRKNGSSERNIDGPIISNCISESSAENNTLPFGVREGFYTFLKDTFDIIEDVNTGLPVISRKNLIKVDIKIIKKKQVFICYFWKKGELDFGTLEFTPHIIAEPIKVSDIPFFTSEGLVEYTVYYNDGIVRYKQNGFYENNNKYAYVFTKSKEGDYMTFISLSYAKSIISNSEENINYFIGAFSTDLSDNNSSSGITILEKYENIDEAIGKIKQYFDKKSGISPDPRIGYYLQSKRLKTDLKNALGKQSESLPSNIYIEKNKEKEYAGIYHAFFINTRENIIEKNLYVLHEDGSIEITSLNGDKKIGHYKIKDDKEQNGYLIFCKIDFNGDDDYRAEIVFQDIFEENGKKYLQGVLSGKARRSSKPILSRIILKFVSKTFNQEQYKPDEYKLKTDTIEDKEKRVQEEMKLQELLKNENNLLRFFWGYEEEKNNKDLGKFGESLKYFNEIAEDNFDVKSSNQSFNSLDRTQKSMLNDSVWNIYFYHRYEEGKVPNMIIKEGIACGTLRFSKNGCEILSIPEKKTKTILEEYSGFITLQKNEYVFFEFFSLKNDNNIKNKTQINLKIYFKDTNYSIGIYTRIERDQIISGFVVLEKKKNSIDVSSNNDNFLEKYDTELLNKIDPKIVEFIFKHTKNAISIKPILDIEAYTGINLSKKIYKPINVYLTSPATFIKSDEEKNIKDVFDNLKAEILEIKTNIIQLAKDKKNTSEKEFNVFCAFDEYEFDDIKESNDKIYNNLLKKITQTDSLVVIYHKCLGENIGQSSFIIEFGWASMLKIPIYVFQMEGTKLPNLIEGGARDGKNNIHIITRQTGLCFKDTDDIIRYLTKRYDDLAFI